MVQLTGPAFFHARFFSPCRRHASAPILEASELPPDAVEVGRITDAWGVKGWFKVLPYSSSPEALLASRTWFF